ncbi:MAG: DUF5686 and carboxypeptidase regulatory-like domain-containing protein [Bacteroidales bacterium]|nr:DUF5686 and carboxypeptidase regulatory-like domain-containing protein [Bacteroidales bacterium]
MRKIIFTTLLILLGLYTYSQCIEGRITSNTSDTIAYATIYAQGISKGTTSNIEGNYQLDLPNGNHIITIRYLGYKTQQINVNCSGSTQKLDIILEEQAYKIPEVRILASGEDPAYSIMRKAVAMSYYYLNQVEEYNCRIYLKGTGEAVEIPRLLQKTFKKEGIEEGKPMVTENITDLHFMLPDIVEETVISMRSSMKGNDVSTMGYITLSLYNDIDGVKSPLSKDAFTYYKFQLDASFYEQEYLVHKIKVIPRREGFDLYSGHIYIVEGFWHLHSAELQLKQKMFSIKINQVYNPVGNDVWMPVSHYFDIEAGMMGIEFTYKYVASVADYKVKLNTKLDHSVYRNLLADSKEYVNEVNNVIHEQQNEIQKLVQKDDLSKKESRKLKKLVKEDVEKTIPERNLEIKDNNHVEDSAELRSVAYWDSIRPVPLTFEELDSYKTKDSIQLRMEIDTTFRDSLERDDKKFKWGKLLTGGSYNYDGGHRFHYGGLIDLGYVNFNTVDGLKYGMEFNYTYSSDSTGKYFRIRQNADYAFARERMTSDFSLIYRYQGLKQGYVYLDGGRKTSDFDANTGITENLNLITTLVLKENHLKLYQKDYLSIGHRIDIAHGLDFLVNFEYAQRTELDNHSDFYFYDPFNNDFTSNTPSVLNNNNALTVDHDASIMELRVRYTPEYFYRINDGVKRYLYSNYPTFTLSYFKGIKEFLDSDVDFDRLEVSVGDSRSIRKIGNIYLELTAGSFLNTSRLYFADYKHFGTNSPFLIGSSEGSIFRLLDYYDYSSNNSYLEGHARLENDRILLKRLPVLNKTLMREAIYINYLSTTGNKPYYEIGYGLNQIFLMFSVEVFAGFKGSVHEYTGIKIGIPFVGGSGTEIRVGG